MQSAVRERAPTKLQPSYRLTGLAAATEQRLDGFLSEVEVQTTTEPDSILLLGRFDVGRYRPALFGDVGIAFPDQLSSAVTRRQAEFLAGRLMARRALLSLGQPARDIHANADRSPAWPMGSAGSISHTGDRCACFAIPGTRKLVGIDIERVPDGNALSAVLGSCLTQKERALVSAQGQLSEAQMAGLIFSAKETLFKMLYPVVGAFFGFMSAEVHGAPDGSVLRLRLTRDLAAGLSKGIGFDVHYDIGHDHVLTWACAQKPAPDTPPVDR